MALSIARVIRAWLQDDDGERRHRREQPDATERRRMREFGYYLLAEITANYQPTQAQDSVFTITDTPSAGYGLKHDVGALTTNRTWTAQDVSGTVYVSGGTDIPVTDGGTGASTASGACDNLGIIKRARTTDASKTTDTTLADDTQLTMSVEANAKYDVRCHLILNAHATPDAKVDFTLPAGASFIWTGAASTGLGGATPITAGTPQALNGAGADRLFFFIGILQTAGTAGTFALQWAQNTSDGNATTLKAGSLMWAHRCG